MNLNAKNTIYFLGIGGIGMSALARYFLASNYTVLGYDKTKTELTEALEKEGAIVHYNEDVEIVQTLIETKNDQVLFCYTPAIPASHSELAWLKQNGIELVKRSVLLGAISKDYFTIAVAGTHGKTTTSSIVAHLLHSAGKKCNAFLGGISINFNSNLVLNDEADILVVEADEYDRSFLTLSPNLALITSMDADHLDVYGNANTMDEAYAEFAACLKQNGKLITKPRFKEHLKPRSDIELSTYSVDQQANFCLETMAVKGGTYQVNFQLNGEQLHEVSVGLPGIHNVENALGAAAIGHALGLSNEQIKQGLSSYKGVKRRFERIVDTSDLTYIDDYAHHPTEIDKCVQSLRELYPNRKLTAIFQPHLYSRTRDFMDGFAKSLSQVDELILIDIYPAREEPIPGVDSHALLSKITLEEKTCVALDEVLSALQGKQLELLVTMGAGDIDTLVNPIKQKLEGQHA